jgi:hypothetical protein
LKNGDVSKEAFGWDAGTGVIEEAITKEGRIVGEKNSERTLFYPVEINYILRLPPPLSGPWAGRRVEMGVRDFRGRNDQQKNR